LRKKNSLQQKRYLTKRTYPRGDNDNYEKAIWDAVTKNKAAWNDDDQIILNITHKRYTDNPSEAGFYLHIYIMDKHET
jgi:Holliday junction resolvase RusA-like endonuclease